MRNFSEEIKKAGELKILNEELKKQKQFNDLIDVLMEIKRHSDTLNVLIANGEALREANLLPYNPWSTARQFYADGCRHCLGFLYAEKICPEWVDSKRRGKVNALGVLGGGANGNVSVIYFDNEMWLGNEDGNQCTPLKEYVSPSCSDFAYKSLMRRIGDYTHEAKKFLRDLEEREFETMLSELIESVI